MNILTRTLSPFAALALILGTAAFSGCDTQDPDVTYQSDDSQTRSVDELNRFDPNERQDQATAGQSQTQAGRQMPQQAPQVNIDLTASAIRMPEELAPGEYELQVTNSAPAEQTFEIEGPGLDRGLTGRLEPGDTQRFRVSLQQGDYTISGQGQEQGSVEKQLSVTQNAPRTPGQQGQPQQQQQQTPERQQQSARPTPGTQPTEPTPQ